jgi:hypothetical protein
MHSNPKWALDVTDRTIRLPVMELKKGFVYGCHALGVQAPAKSGIREESPRNLQEREPQVLKRIKHLKPNQNTIKFKLLK